MIKKLPDWFPKCLHIFHSHQKCVRAPYFPTFSSTPIISKFFFFFLSLVILVSVKWYLRGLDFHFPEHLFMCIPPFVHLLWSNVHSSLLPSFHWVLFLPSSYEWSSYILHVNLLSAVWFANLFSYSIGWLFPLVKCSLSKKTLIFHRIQFMCLPSVPCALGSKNSPCL